MTYITTGKTDSLGAIIVEVAVALMSPNLPQAMEKAAEAISGCPWVKGAIIDLWQQQNGESVSASAGDVSSARLSDELPLKDQIQWRGEWAVLAFPVDGVTGRLTIGLIQPPSQKEVKSVTPVVHDIVRLVTHRILSQGFMAEVEENRLFVDALSTLSHDLRTPLASIKGYASLLMNKEEKWKSSKDEFLEIILEECDHIERLTLSLLDVASEDSAFVRKELVLIPPMLNRILERSYRSSGHKFIVDIPENARQVYADRLGLEQVFRNLVDNAVKYSPERSLIVIRAKCTNDSIVVSIADQGHGIAPEHLNRLFERFYRIKDKHSARISGSGLGLPIARRIIEGHGGRIWAESVVDKGSVFHFSIPCGSVSP